MPEYPEQYIIQKALSLAIEANKKLYQKKEGLGFHDLYKESVEMAEQISYHAIKDVFPEKLFKNRSPNQTEKEAKYIKENYKQHTLPVFLDYINTITRPFGDGNWAIDFKEDEQAFKNTSFQSYVENGLPKYGSLENFVKGILPTLKSIDANGFVAVRPEKIDYDDLDDGTQVISDKPYEPTIFYYSSRDVIDYEIGKYYLFLSPDKTIVQFGTASEKSGNKYELYTKDAVFFIIQEGRKSDNRFRVEEFYRHNLDDCQVDQLKGIPTLKENKILWQSPFLYATDLLDLVAMNGNFLQALINNCVFPVKVMFGSPCEFRDTESDAVCDGGSLIINGIPRSCPSCNGIGLKSRISPLGTLLLNPTTKFTAGEEKSSQDPLKYVSPEIHTLEFLDKKIATDEQKARAILHLRNKNSTVSTQNDITATEIFDDSKAMISFVKPISDQIFYLYEFFLNAIGLQRYGESFKKPEMTYPKTFDFKSSEDYLNDIGNAMKNNLPPAFIQLLLLQYINSYYGDNEKSTHVFKLVMASDRIFGMSQDEINMKMSKGTVSKWEDILHSSSLSFINDALTENSEFTALPMDAQVNKIQDLAKKKSDELDSAAVKIYDTPTI